MDLLDLCVILRSAKLDEKDFRRKENRHTRGINQCVDNFNRLLEFKDFICPSCQNNCHSEFRYPISSFQFESLIINSVVKLISFSVIKMFLMMISLNMAFTVIEQSNREHGNIIKILMLKINLIGENVTILITQ